MASAEPRLLERHKKPLAVGGPAAAMEVMKTNNSPPQRYSHVPPHVVTDSTIGWRLTVFGEAGLNPDVPWLGGYPDRPFNQIPLHYILMSRTMEVMAAWCHLQFVFGIGSSIRHHIQCRAGCESVYAIKRFSQRKITAPERLAPESVFRS